jgi:hypothetical protein
VAAVDLTFPYFIDTLLESPTLQKAGEAFLVDTEDKILVRASEKALARDVDEYINPEFADPDKGVGAEGRAILAAAKAQSNGHLELADGKLAVWSKVEATGWLYVVIGDLQAMLEASAGTGAGDDS